MYCTENVSTIGTDKMLKYIICFINEIKKSLYCITHIVRLGL